MGIYVRRSLICHYYFEEDLRHALNLYNYMKYGIFIRGCLEHHGPYDILDFSPGGQNMNKETINKFRGIGSIKSAKEFNRHRKEYLGAARQQLLINFFSIFEFLIGNTLIALWNLSEVEEHLGNELYCVWSSAAKENYRIDPRLSSIETPAWLENNHKWEFLKKRMGVLSDHLKVDVKNIHIECDGRKYGWSDFCNLREERHRIVHAAGRQSVFSDNAYKKLEVSESDIMCAHKFIVRYQTSIVDALYEVPILRDDLAGKRSDGW